MSTVVNKTEETETVVKQNGIRVEASINSTGREKLAHLLLRLPSQGSPFAYLNQFYVVSRVEKEKCSEQHKGLGKRLLCETIGWLINEKLLKPETNIKLEASGGCASEEFTSTESEETLNAFLTKYPKAMEDLKKDANREKREITIEDKARLAEAIRQNHRLIAYYTKTYGFEVDEDFGECARMSGTIQGILNACKSGGKRKKTRGRRKATRTRRTKKHT